MVRLVDAILVDAVKSGASDIHFNPEKSFLRLRYRIDGVLQQVRSLHKDYWSPISVRLKVMADLNIAETRSPQDGRISLKFSGKPIDFRVSVQPTTDGENIVLRVLDRSKGIVPLDKINLFPENLRLLKSLMARPEGIILVTGPTGSGKTTTLYSMLNDRKSIEVNIMTLEDPVEYPIDLIRQTSISDSAKIDFASGIRSLMRQDPDIIPRILAGNIIGIVGQRLVRTLCTRCKQPRPTEEYEQIILGQKNPVTVFEPTGCDHGNNTGFKGRVSLIEILTMNEELDDLVASRSTRRELKQAAIASGFKDMAEDGIRRVLAGDTTIEEVSRVVNLTQRLH